MPTQPLISIVDDDSSVREAAMDLLHSMGFVAEAFQHAEDFLKSNRLQKTSCLIADVQMPGMTGLELHDYLVQSGTAVPTILVTAFPDERDRVHALQTGVLCYLAKPFHQDELLACIQSAIEHRNADARG